MVKLEIGSKAQSLSTTVCSFGQPKFADQSVLNNVPQPGDFFFADGRRLLPNSFD